MVVGVGRMDFRHWSESTEKSGLQVPNRQYLILPINRYGKKRKCKQKFYPSNGC